MNGHGHVVPSADGSRARCGGPGICIECSREAAGAWRHERERAERAEAERDALRRDAERYRWLRDRLTHQRCGPNVGWATDELLPGDDPDDAIDCAMMRERIAAPE